MDHLARFGGLVQGSDGMQHLLCQLALGFLFQVARFPSNDKLHQLKLIMKTVTKDYRDPRSEDFALLAEAIADIMDKILKMAPDGVLTGTNEQNVMEAFMYCTDKYTLSDPAALAMHNYIVDKVHQVMFEPQWYCLYILFIYFNIY